MTLVRLASTAWSTARREHLMERREEDHKEVIALELSRWKLCLEPRWTYFRWGRRATSGCRFSAAGDVRISWWRSRKSSAAEQWNDHAIGWCTSDRRNQVNPSQRDPVEQHHGATASRKRHRPAGQQREAGHDASWTVQSRRHSPICVKMGLCQSVEQISKCL